jgi:hypothetical protein
LLSDTEIEREREENERRKTQFFEKQNFIPTRFALAELVRGFE